MSYEYDSGLDRCQEGRSGRVLYYAVHSQEDREGRHVHEGCVSREPGHNLLVCPVQHRNSRGVRTVASVTLVTHCDGPGCDTYGGSDWLRVSDDTGSPIGDFCTRWCLARWAASAEPTEHIPL